MRGVSPRESGVRCYSPAVLRRRRTSSPTFRRLIVVLTVFGAIVVLDLALFGWLTFHSLSQREIEQVLLETRQEAEGIASRIEGRALDEGTDLYTVIAVERDTRTYIDDVARELGVVRSIRILDADGTLVYEANSDVRQPVGDEPLLDLDQPQELPEDWRTQESRTESRYQVEQPIGDFGILRIGIDEEDLQARIAELRGDLIGQASVIGAVTTLLLIAAIALMWALLRRSHRLEQQAAEAERMAYIGTLASGLAHEIRNPLNSVSLNMQMLEEEMCETGGVEAASSGRRLLGITRSEIARLERLVTDFLSYARPRQLEVEEVEAAELLDQVRELLAGEARSRGVSLEVEERSGGATVRVDPGQIRQLILNLTQNALTAVEGRGAPRVVLGCQLRDAWEAGSAGVELSVRDNGRGMSEEELGQIFEVFYSTRKGGTGLGLAIVDRIVRRHEGTLEVESEPDAGTTIRVVLPRPAVPIQEGLAIQARDRADGAEGRGERAAGHSPVSSSSSVGERNSSRSSLPQTSQRASVISPSFHSKT